MIIMKALVIYDTIYGNTKQVAEIIAESLNNHSQQIKAEAKFVSHISINDLQDSQLIILGSPTHYWKETRKIREFILSFSRLRLKPYFACFCTKLQGSLSGSAANKLDMNVRKLGFTTISEPLNIYVESFKGPLKSGEKQTAERFASFLADNCRQISTELVINNQIIKLNNR